MREIRQNDHSYCIHTLILRKKSKLDDLAIWNCMIVCHSSKNFSLGSSKCVKVTALLKSMRKTKNNFVDFDLPTVMKISVDIFK